MSNPVLGAAEEAVRLWGSAKAARGRAADDLDALFTALDFGVRTAEILVNAKLEPVRSHYPATIESLLEPPPPEVDVVRDAVQTPKTLQFIHVLDMLSADDLDCVSPDLHRGWEDRRFSCKRSREKARKAVGVTLDAGQRDRLMTLCAYRNRIFRIHPPVEVDTTAIVDAFAALDELVGALSPELA